VKVFYWTERSNFAPSQFIQVNTKTEGVYIIDEAGVTKGNIIEMLEEGHIEISPSTAFKMGLPT
jgi:hypothetical protein